MSEIQDHSIYSVKYQNSLRGMIRFELISLYGRIFLNKKPRLTDNLNLLHLGCSHNKFVGWVNADFYQGVKFWKKYPNKPDWTLDLRYPLNCDSDYWDGIFTEHTLEHLLPLHVLNLLKEILRTLKPGCWLRVSVPDLGKYVDYYSGKKSHENFKRWPTGAEAIRSLTQNWGHLSVWDSELLGNFLHEAGFVNTRKVNFSEGTDKRIIKDNEKRRWESLYMEAQKPQKNLRLRKIK